MQTLTIQTPSHSRTTTKPKAPKGAPRKPRGESLEALRAYINRGDHLRDKSQPLTLDNLKTLREISREVGYSGHGSAGHVIRSEFPGVAALMRERKPYPDTRAPKKVQLFRYIEQGRHLRDPEGELSATNVKSQREIARDLGTTQRLISYHTREYFPHIAAVMAERKWHESKD